MTEKQVGVTEYKIYKIWLQTVTKYSINTHICLGINHVWLMQYTWLKMNISLSQRIKNAIYMIENKNFLLKLKFFIMHNIPKNEYVIWIERINYSLLKCNQQKQDIKFIKY